MYYQDYIHIQLAINITLIAKSIYFWFSKINLTHWSIYSKREANQRPALDPCVQSEMQCENHAE